MHQKHRPYLSIMILIISVSICRTVEDDDQPRINDVANKLMQFWRNMDESITDVKRINDDVSRPRYNPKIALIGLGKRKNDKPKYDPGWEFIGLGKRQEDQQENDSKTSNMEEHYDPYLNILALSNLSKFFHHLKKEFEENQQDYGENFDLKHDYSKKSRKQKYWKSNQRPVYDPSWSLIGLGKK